MEPFLGKELLELSNLDLDVIGKSPKSFFFSSFSVFSSASTFSMDDLDIDFSETTDNADGMLSNLVVVRLTKDWLDKLESDFNISFFSCN